jgi:hypothetical protein
VGVENTKNARICLDALSSIQIQLVLRSICSLLPSQGSIDRTRFLPRRVQVIGEAWRCLGVWVAGISSQVISMLIGGLFIVTVPVQHTCLRSERLRYRLWSSTAVSCCVGVGGDIDMPWMSANTYDMSRRLTIRCLSCGPYDKTDEGSSISHYAKYSPRICRDPARLPASTAQLRHRLMGVPGINKLGRTSLPRDRSPTRGDTPELLRLFGSS